MKRLLALLAGAFGLRALLRRRPRPAFPQGASPADELRTRLAEARSAPQPLETEPAAAEPVLAEPAPAEPEAAGSPEPASVDELSVDELSVDELSVDELSVDERRADVHNRARGAIDELRS